MNSENFLELPNDGGIALVSKSSIAAIEMVGHGSRVTLKETRPDGKHIVFNVQLPFSHLATEISKYEKIQ